MSAQVFLLLVLLFAIGGFVSTVFARLYQRQARVQRDLRDLAARVAWVGGMYGSVMKLKQQAEEATGAFRLQHADADQALATFQQLLDAERLQAVELVRALSAQAQADTQQLVASTHAFLAHAVISAQASTLPGANGHTLHAAPPAVSAGYWQLRKVVLARQVSALEEAHRDISGLLAKFEATLAYVPSTHARVRDIHDAMTALHRRLEQVETDLRQHQALVREAEVRQEIFTRIVHEEVSTRDVSIMLPVVASGTVPVTAAG
jgi:peptidoglycan hydrolase CwlO-like protein